MQKEKCVTTKIMKERKEKAKESVQIWEESHKRSRPLGKLRRFSTLTKTSPVQRSQSEDGNERYERNELLLLKRPSTQTNQTNTSGRNTSPYSPSSRGGSAASAVGDRECINKQGRRLDPSHPRGGRGGSAASAAAGEGSTPAHPLQGESNGAIVPHQAFPTASKEREKRKEAEDKSKGVEKIVKKKPKVIERHRDDCGDDLRGLGDHLACRCCDVYSSSSEEEEGVPRMQGGEGNHLPIYWFEPKPSSWEDLQMRASSHFLLFN